MSIKKEEFFIHHFMFQEGAFALCFKSKLYPGECVATRRGSPLLVAFKTNTRLATDHVPILYSKGKRVCVCLRIRKTLKLANVILLSLK